MATMTPRTEKFAGSRGHSADDAMLCGWTLGDDWDVSRRPKTSQDAVETSLPSLVSSTGMTSTAGTDTGIGDGARAATPTGGGTGRRRPSVRYGTGTPQRVRAFMRVTRSAKGLTWNQSVEAGGPPWRTPLGGGRAPVWLWSDAGGPGPLTEGRQKKRRPQRGACALGRLPRRDGMHGTRNTVPSIAFGEAKPCRSPRSLSATNG